MTLYIFDKNIFDKMIDIQECENEETRFELITKYCCFFVFGSGLEKIY